MEVDRDDVQRIERRVGDGRAAAAGEPEPAQDRGRLSEVEQPRAGGVVDGSVGAAQREHARAV